MLDDIWRKSYSQFSFPKFKFMLYSRDQELQFIKDYTILPALCVSIAFADEFRSIFNNVWEVLKSFINKKVLSSEHTAVGEIVENLQKNCGIGKYKAQAICEVVISSMDSYRKNFAKTSSPIAIEKATTEGKIKYQFNVAVNSYFRWIEMGFQKIVKETVDGELHLINDNGNKTKEYGVVLGILEAIDVLSFKMLGGANSQLYIYVNQIQSLKNILNAPYNYENRLLNTVAERHMISVKMLTHIYEGDFTNEEMWNLLEDYFLGAIPEKVKHECRKENSDIEFD